MPNTRQGEGGDPPHQPPPMDHQLFSMSDRKPQLSLFPEEATPPSPSLPAIPPGVFFGTSTWNYRGWAGQVYSPKVARSRDVNAMLEEYARYPLFNTVGIDGTFYRPYSREQFQGLAACLPPGFPCVSKVWEELTIRQFANVGRFEKLAGQRNPHYLNVALFLREIFEPNWETFRDHMGPFVFELQACPPHLRPTDTEFSDELETFFAQLPAEGKYAIELRDPALLTPAYFAALARHGVAHVFNSWTRMPKLHEQMAQRPAPTASFEIARLLLKPGRRYDEAVQTFKPYDRIQEPQPEVRADTVGLLRDARAGERPAYVLVNNRLEGNAPATIQALAEELEKEDTP